MARGVGCVLLLQFLCLSSAYKLKCTVRQHGDLTYYSINDTSNVSLTGCHYDWSNGTDHIIATQLNELTGLVMKNTINHLITSKCLNTVRLTGHCPTEDDKRNVTCNTICHENAPHNKEDDLQKATGRNRVGVIIALSLLLVVLGLCYAYSNKTSRLCCRGQSSCLHSSANMHKTPINHPSEESLVEIP